MTASEMGFAPPLSLSQHHFGPELRYLEFLRVEVCPEGSTFSLPANLNACERLT